MNTFAIKEKRATPAIRRSQLSRFGYRGPEVKAQQAEIHRILRSTGAQAKLTINKCGGGTCVAGQGRVRK